MNRAIPVIIIDAALLVLFCLFRTTAAIVTPWDLFSVWVFVAYAIASALLVNTLSRGDGLWALVATAVHAAVTWMLSAIVFAYGFGYDPFVHRAGEMYMLEHLAPIPNQPLYIGQYVIVVILALVTRLRIATIDAWLVPLLAVTAFLPAFWIGMKRGWEPHRASAVGALAIFLLPLSSFTFTIPYNLAFILLGIVVALLPVTTKRVTILLVCLAILALATHPLLGIPIAIIVCARLLALKIPERFLTPFVAILTAASLAVAFIFYAQIHGSAISLPSSSSVTDSLWALFGFPYPVTFSLLSLLYAATHLWPLCFIAISLWGMKQSNILRTSHVRILLGSAIGLLAASVFVGVLVRLPDILDVEQFEFSLRLIEAIPFLFLPGVALALAKLIPSSTMRRTGFVFLTCVVVMTTMWFMSYPGHNVVSYQTAPSVGKEEEEAVITLDRLANGSAYAVLSHQMMSAAALDQFGFSREIVTDAGKRSPYAVPTGGELYAEYQELLASHEPQETLASIFEFTNVKMLFIVVPTAWDPDEAIRARLGGLAFATVLVNDRFVVFEYHHN